MCHTTPATYLFWSVLSCLHATFLVWHLWKYDRFRCLRWNNGPYSGAFKRLMTYTYLLCVPAIIIYTTGFAIIKYQEGFLYIPQLKTSVPMPSSMWTEAHKSAIFPLSLLFSAGWGLEMVTHLEELCFWLFLVNADRRQQDWFQSPYFKTFVVGSVIAVIYMPCVTIFTRHDPLEMEAYTFLAGGLGSLSLTLWFTPILFTFGAFINNLEQQGVERATIVRLTLFHELNRIRIAFRLMFVVPLIILGIDGVRPHHHINESQFWTEFLTLLAAIGCIVSSDLTLVVFFPRNIESELASRKAPRRLQQPRSAPPEKSRSRASSYLREETESEVSSIAPLPSLYKGERERDSHDEEMELEAPPLLEPAARAFSPNRRMPTGEVVPGKYAPPAVDLDAEMPREPPVHQFNFTSPIDLMEGGQRKTWYVKRSQLRAQGHYNV